MIKWIINISKQSKKIDQISKTIFLLTPTSNLPRVNPRVASHKL